MLVDHLDDHGPVTHCQTSAPTATSTNQTSTATVARCTIRRRSSTSLPTPLRWLKAPAATPAAPPCEPSVALPYRADARNGPPAASWEGGCGRNLRVAAKGPTVRREREDGERGDWMRWSW